MADEIMDALIEVAREEGFKRGVLRAAFVAAAWAQNYPEDVFPPDGTSTDCQSAAWARHTTSMITHQILAILKDEPEAE